MGDGRKRLDWMVTASVVALCAITLMLVLLLPSDSLVVDLIYQGF